MPQIGPAEILVILLVGLLVFGPHRLPEIGRQVGKGMRELRKFQDTIKGELDQVLNLDDDHDEPSVLPASSPGPQQLPPPAKSDDSVASPSARSDARPAKVRAPEAGRSGAHAPSRYRTSKARPADVGTATVRTPEVGRSGAQAPSRFRAPGSPPPA
jgi:Tat protein translocase TatB subunit